MTDPLVLIHTVSPLVEVFTRLCAEILPGVRIIHILDEPLLERIRLRGGLHPQDSARLDTHAEMAEAVNAAAVLVTCSTVSPAVDGMLPRAFPVFKIDTAMVAEAVRQGGRIGVIATNPTTLAPTRSLLQGEATARGKTVDVEMLLVEGALKALMNGDGATHDALVLQAVAQISARVDVVVLAQASMARVLAGLPAAHSTVPILTSPHLALEQVKTAVFQR